MCPTRPTQVYGRPLTGIPPGRRRVLLHVRWALAEFLGEHPADCRKCNVARNTGGLQVHGNADLVEKVMVARIGVGPELLSHLQQLGKHFALGRQRIDAVIALRTRRPVELADDLLDFRCRDPSARITGYVRCLDSRCGLRRTGRGTGAAGAGQRRFGGLLTTGRYAGEYPTHHHCCASTREQSSHDRIFAGSRHAAQLHG